jgi:VCBS repeat-containing protein
MLSLDSTAVKNGSGKLAWNFDSVSKESLDMIPEGETMVLEYTVTQKDPHGESATQTVTVAITGTNDAPKVQIQDGDSAEGKIVDWTKNVTGSLTIIDEDVVGAFFKTVSLDGKEITDTNALIVLESLFVYDKVTSTFETENEDGNYDWVFLTSDAVRSGLSAWAGAGDHKLTYNMNFRDDHLIATSQEINILFTV